METTKKITLEDVPALLLEIKEDIARLGELQKPQQQANRIMRHREAAEYTGFSESRLYQTEAPFHKQGGTRFYLESELRDWLLRNK